MKSICFILILIFAIGKVPKVYGQSEETQQLVLNIEKLRQFKKILEDMYKGYKILSQGYEKVKDISKGNFNLHKNFLDGLMAVSPTVKKYKKVSDIVNLQLKIVKEYKIYYSRFKANNTFSASEIGYLLSVYENLTNQSVDNLESLITVITADKLRMSDDERLTSIDRIFDDMQEKLSFLRHFNNNTTLLAVQRAKERNDIEAIRDLYGLTN